MGSCLELMIGGVHGLDEVQVYKELCEVVDEWIQIHEEEGESLPPGTAGRQCSGKFVLRLGKNYTKRWPLRRSRPAGALIPTVSRCLKTLRKTNPRGKVVAPRITRRPINSRVGITIFIATVFERLCADPQVVAVDAFVAG